MDMREALNKAGPGGHVKRPYMDRHTYAFASPFGCYISHPSGTGRDLSIIDDEDWSADDWEIVP